MAQTIPLTSSPNQSFSVQLQVDGQALTLNLNLFYSEMAGYWVLTIADASGNVLLDSIPMITGWYPAANILSQYTYLKIGSCFLLNTGNQSDDYPGPNDMENWTFLWDDTPGYEAAA